MTNISPSHVTKVLFEASFTFLAAIVATVRKLFRIARAEYSHSQAYVH
jgi:hypothetical protein